ncbi:MAG: hypothetical protein JO263_09040 [Candidatus Eremiobacteraeota bacterium]|nr:hypothetical protein [Candidatus Eremiobacteraeota bacterium]
MDQPLRTLFGALGAASIALIWAGCGSGFSAPPRTPTASVKPIPAGTISSSHAVIYVADSAQNLQGPRRVVEFDTSAKGDVSPLRTIEGRKADLEGPTFVALDGTGALYVVNQNLLRPKIVPVIAVFAPGASGDTPPIRKIWLSSVQSYPPRPFIAVDPAGYLYVANGQRQAIDIYAPDAKGTPSPVRSIVGPRTRISNLFGVAVDSSGNIIATGYINNRLDSPRVLVFPPNANGNVPPKREIRGLNTQLYGPGSCAVDGAGNLYVSDNQNYSGHILVFAPGANGNVPPIRVITPDQATFINGIALRGNEIFASEMYFPKRRIAVYPLNANGTTKPLRTIAGDETKLLTFIGSIAVQ